VRSVTRQNYDKATVAGLRNGITNGRFAHLPTPIKHPPWQQRVETIASGLLADLGGEDEVSFQERILIERCAVLVLQLELQEQQWCEKNAGQSTDLQSLVYTRGLNAVRRCFETLTAGLHRRAKTVTAPPSIEAYLRSKKQYAPEADDDAADAAE
jgi:hypothetical protein